VEQIVEGAVRLSVMWLSHVNSVSFNTPYVDALSFSVTSAIEILQSAADRGLRKSGGEEPKSESGAVRLDFDR
jgi:hypothetical protein